MPVNRQDGHFFMVERTIFRLLVDVHHFKLQRHVGPDDLRAAISKGLAANEPVLIEVPVGEMPFPWPYIDLPRVRGKK